MVDLGAAAGRGSGDAGPGGGGLWMTWRHWPTVESITGPRVAVWGVVVVGVWGATVALMGHEGR
jgi:hypothetical protein